MSMFSMLSILVQVLLEIVAKRGKYGGKKE